MSCIKLSIGTRLLLLVVAMVLACGFVPLFLIYHGSPGDADLIALSNQVEKLEREHRELKDFIAKLELRGNERSSSVNEMLGPSPTSPSHNSSKPPNTAEQFISETEHDPPSSIEFPEPITYNTPTSQSSESVLVVGGTDGSGTRRVVQILSQLGVLMVSEDPETYDIHADIVGGWPNVVLPVLTETRSISYNPAKLPEKIRTSVSGLLQKLLNLVESDSRKSESHILAKGGSLPKPSNVTAKAVKYGFKAPVAMTLGPYWSYLLNDFKMLHVLRDGRDIAFSANQGPVQKFFDCMYENVTPSVMMERDEVKAMRLWSDWNAGLRSWAASKVDEYPSDTANSGKSFGYYALHSEDLVHENASVRYATLANLASWLGSDISDRALCCIAVRGSEFLGSHDRTSIDPRVDSKLTSRYGKWRKKLALDVELGASMMSVGTEGLKQFGYEPLRDFKSNNNIPHNPNSNFGKVTRAPCNLGVKDCPAPTAAPFKIIDAAVWGVKGLCEVVAGVDYKGGDLDSFSIPLGRLNVPNYTECCRRCKDNPGCRYFTIDTRKLMCYLKSEKQSTEKTDMTVALVSGNML